MGKPGNEASCVWENLGMRLVVSGESLGMGLVVCGESLGSNCTLECRLWKP